MVRCVESGCCMQWMDIFTAQENTASQSLNEDLSIRTEARDIWDGSCVRITCSLRDGGIWREWKPRLWTLKSEQDRTPCSHGIKLKYITSHDQFNNLVCRLNLANRIYAKLLSLFVINLVFLILQKNSSSQQSKSSSNSSSQPSKPQSHTPTKHSQVKWVNLESVWLCRSNICLNVLTRHGCEKPRLNVWLMIA